MKSIFFFVLILANTFINALEYINFIPNEDTGCTNTGGMGYSILLNSCFAISQSDNGWYFTYNSETESIQGTEYINSVNQPLCDSSRRVNSQMQLNNGDCFNKVLEFSNKQSPIDTPWYQVLISNEPTLPVDIQSYSYMLNGCNSNTTTNENLLIGMEYFTNSSQAYNQVKGQWQVDIYYCQNDVPYVIDPIYQESGITCNQQSYQFSNTSSSTPQSLYIYHHCI